MAWFLKNSRLSDIHHIRRAVHTIKRAKKMSEQSRVWFVRSTLELILQQLAITRQKYVVVLWADPCWRLASRCRKDSNPFSSPGAG